MKNQTTLIATGVGIIVFLTSVFLSQLFNLINLSTFLLGAGVFVLIVWGVALVVWKTSSEHYKDEFMKLINILQHTIPSTGHDWLYHGSEILNLEEQFIDNDIWIISPHLENDTGSQYSEETLASAQKALKRGIRYTFIVPDTQGITRVLPQLYRGYSDFLDQLQVIKLPIREFRTLIMTEVAIYNPNMVNGRSPFVYVELPLEPHLYWCKVADSIAFEFIEHLRPIISKNTNNSENAN